MAGFLHVLSITLRNFPFIPSFLSIFVKKWD